MSRNTERAKTKPFSPLLLPEARVDHIEPFHAAILLAEVTPFPRLLNKPPTYNASLNTERAYT